jgi:hypothetical protein
MPTLESEDRVTFGETKMSNGDNINLQEHDNSLEIQQLTKDVYIESSMDGKSQKQHKSGLHLP